MRRKTDKWVAVCTFLCILCAIVTGVVGRTVIDVNAQNAKLEAQNAKLEAQADRTDRLAEDNRKAVHELRALQRRFVAESRKRRDQSCRGDERDHLRDVRQLRRTYEFLETAQDPDLIRAVLGNLPQLESEARQDTAPAFCDKPGVAAERLYRRTHGERGKPPVGLKEPDPKLPERRSFKHLLRP